MSMSVILECAGRLIALTPLVIIRAAAAQGTHTAKGVVEVMFRGLFSRVFIMGKLSENCEECICDVNEARWFSFTNASIFALLIPYAGLKVGIQCIAKHRHILSGLKKQFSVKQSPNRIYHLLLSKLLLMFFEIAVLKTSCFKIMV